MSRCAEDGSKTADEDIRRYNRPESHPKRVCPVRLEDCLLYLVVDVTEMAHRSVNEFVAESIRGGINAIQVRGAVSDSGTALKSVARDTVAICRREDTLVMIAENVGLALAVGADGVHLGRGNLDASGARLAMGMDALIGMTTASPDEAELALSLGVDYLLQDVGSGGAEELAGLTGMAGGVPLFAAGFRGVAAARDLVARGVYRLCLDAGMIDSNDVYGAVGEFSKLLGRSL